jgi:hypothetical protein
MSEPKSTSEIEDVLSSIRRLVSEDLRPAPAPAAVAAGKLILTPALRVVPPAEAPSDAPSDASAEAAIPDPAQAPASAPAPSPDVGAVVSRLGAAVDADAEEWEAPDGDLSAWDGGDMPPRLHLSPAGQGAMPSWVEDWADQAEAEVRARLERDLAEAAPAPEAPASLTFDEAVLRDLVRDILREELAGALGERITRNVRKLVRAEIARALAARDFD